MSDFFDDNQIRSEVEHLHRLAMDAHDEAQYATMEQLLEQAVATAEQLGDLPLLVRERAWLANARRMQSKDRQAIATYTWLIGLATDPASSQQLTDDESLSYMARAFMGFVDCGSYLPEMPVEQLLRVVDDGLHWAQRIGKPGWIAGLRLLLADLLSKRGDLKGARQELEAALAVARRHPNDSSYTLATYQLDLAHLLINKAIGGYAEAVELAEEVLTATQNSIYDRQRAYRELAYARLALGEKDAALRAAHECLSLTPMVESPQAAASAYQLIGQIHWEGNRLDEALAAVAQEWYWARRDGSVEYLNLALESCARVRYSQALQACALPGNLDTLPEQVPIEADVLLAVHQLRSARRFIGWAQPLAARLDSASSSRLAQNRLHEILLLVSKLANFLEKHPNAPSDFNQALALGEQDGWLIASRGESYRQLERYEEALADFNQALALDEQDSWTLARRGLAYFQMQRYEDALADFTLALGLGERDSWIFADRGEAYRQLKRYEEALADFTQAIALNQHDSWTIASRGETYRQLERYEEALADFNQAIVLNEQDSWTIGRRGEAYRQLERYEEALADFNQALALGEQDSWTIASRGETYRQLERYEEALADFNQALALNENEDWYLYGRAQVYLLTGEMKAFREDLSSATKLAQDKLSSTTTPDRWLIGFNIAIYHLLDGNAVDAQSMYEELISTCTLLPSLRAAANDLKDLLKVQPQNELAQHIHSRLRTRIAELKQ